jgi:hypothetical protein
MPYLYLACDLWDRGECLVPINEDGQPKLAQEIYPMKKVSTAAIIIVVIILISIIGGAVTIYSTVNGPRGYSDPVAYISTARSLDQGLGFGYFEGGSDFKLLSFHAPLYPIAIAAIGLFGVNLVAAARWLNILSFVFSIFISGWIFFRFSRVPALGIIASALMCIFPYMVEWFSSSYSEPFFIFLFLASGLSLLAYLEKEKPYLLLASALLFGMVPVARYPGISMVFAGGLCVLLFTSGKTLARIKKTVLFLGISSLPILVWFVWINFSTSHSLGDRIIGIVWGGVMAQFQEFRRLFLYIVWKWIPFQSNNNDPQTRFRTFLLVIGVIALPIISLLAEKRLHKGQPASTHKSDLYSFSFFGLSSLAFLAIMIGSYLFTQPTITIDNRTLLPLYGALVLSLLGGFALWQSAWFSGWLRAARILPWLIATICLISYIPQSQALIDLSRVGDSLTAYHWNHSETIQAVRALSLDQPVISNDWELLYLWTGHPIHGFWVTFPPAAPIQATAYGTEPRDATQSLFCGQGAALVIFNDFPAQFESKYSESNQSKLANLFNGLTVYGVYPDGIIYLCRERP